QSREEWVEEWEARQGASAVLAAQRVEDPGAAHQGPATTDPVVGQNKGITAWRRPFAMFLPAARFYGAIVLVCIALLVVLHLVTSKSSSSPEPSAAAFLPKKSTTDSIESSLEPKDLASKESSSEAAVVI